MQVTETALSGVFLVEARVTSDPRGAFLKLLDAVSLGAAGLTVDFSQAAISENTRRYTLRGMHYQAQPAGETKLVFCVRGSVYDVAVDLRPNSPSYMKWHGELLSRDNARGLYLPAGCAHGFLTLEDDSHVHYHIGGEYRPELGRGLRWDDPSFAIDWPHEPLVISERDREYPNFSG